MEDRANQHLNTSHFDPEDVPPEPNYGTAAQGPLSELDLEPYVLSSLFVFRKERTLGDVRPVALLVQSPDPVSLKVAGGVEVLARKKGH
jgi:hypothetical protein